MSTTSVYIKGFKSELKGRKIDHELGARKGDEVRDTKDKRRHFQGRSGLAADWAETAQEET